MLEPSLSSLRRLRNDPLQFVTKVIGVQPTDQQAEILRAIGVPGAHVSVRSGHGPGKTAVEAWIVLWGVGTHTNCRIPATAPSKTQLYDVLWAEIHKWHGYMPEAWRKNYRVTKDHVMLVGKEKSSFAVARTSRRENPEALQGFHAVALPGQGPAFLLFLIEEASGVANEVFQVAEGALSTRDACVLMCSNPTRTQGFFYDSHHRNKDLWKRIRLSSKDSPLVDQKWCERIAKQYGENSAYYQVRVLGNFPTAAADQFIPLGLLEDATFLELLPKSPRVWGVDPAYFGDNFTALARRHGPVVLPMKSVQNMDTMQVVGWLVHEINATPRDEQPEIIYVDSTGMGVGIVDRLRELGYPVVGVNFSMRPASRMQWGNLRTELWALFRERLEARAIQVPNDERVLGEASSALYTFDSNGRVILESKKDARNRGVDSPDHVDAISLTFYNEPAYGSMFGLGPLREIKVETEYDPFESYDYTYNPFGF